MNIAEARTAEHEKYTRCYKQPNYRMGVKRMQDAVRILEEIPTRGSYLDVGTGRGEMLSFAMFHGFNPVKGTEMVKSLLDRPRVIWAPVHDLPFRMAEFHTVTMFDVIEHLIPGDDELACRELVRVASNHVIVAANNMPSQNKAGDDLHINIRPYEEWDRLFCEWFEPHKVVWVTNKTSSSQIWRVDKGMN